MRGQQNRPIVSSPCLPLSPPCRIFKEFTGRTPIDYVNQLRIDQACIDLTLHHKNVTEAALDVGFTDVSYFTKLFKRTKGVTPREYARREK